MDETHEQRAQLLAVEGVLLLRDVHFDLSGGNVIQQHADQLEKEPGNKGIGDIEVYIVNAFIVSLFTMVVHSGHMTSILLSILERGPPLLLS